MKKIEQIKNKYKEFISKDFLGFGCGDGWADLIETVFKYGSKNVEDFEIFQVKEKFGGLRIYCGGKELDVEMEKLLFDAQQKSFGVCEECGEPAKPKTYDGWIKTLCEDCKKNKAISREEV